MTAGRDAVALAERMLQVLEYGSFSATYKFALVTALLDLCFELTTPQGDPPTSITTRQLAEKVTALYWSHAVPFERGVVLRQGGTRAGQQAEILRAIQRLRDRLAGSAEERIDRARTHDGTAFATLVDEVEWKLIEMPIPRLQRVGRSEDRFLYEYGWSEAITRAPVTAYQRGDPSAFDNRLLLRPGVADGLVRLTGVLRPIVQREWALMIAGMNGLPDARLEEFLFGAGRLSLTTIRAPLRDLQSGRCFYCEALLKDAAEVDHFIPWSRYPENGLDNLVVAHPRCNHSKLDFLAAADHVEHWVERGARTGSDLEAIARELDWERAPKRSRSVALAMYSRLPPDSRLWQEPDLFVEADMHRIRTALQRA